MPSLRKNKKLNLADFRVGFGFDSHSFDTNGKLVFGGIQFPSLPKLKGHSDGDALLHALIDSLLGAAGLGDIGLFFPDSEPQWKGVESKQMLLIVLKKISQTGFQIQHVDLTVVAEKPRLSPLRSALIKKISSLLKVNSNQVNIKGKTPEGLQWFSKPGVACWSVATLVKYA
ncbi:MAG: 2-C-methyl-D-erythritol 2,4-cyclodiphosphate synthase [Elusimicrobiota bacterium]